MTELPFVSVIIPAKNEAKILPRCLESLKGVDYPKDRIEVIVADGKSQDGTGKVALGLGATVVSNDKGIVSSGRNRAFEVSRGELIAFTDADCVFDKGWLKNSVKYFERRDVAGVGGLTLEPQDSSDFEKAANCVFAIAEFFRSTSHTRTPGSAREASDIPGCNAIYRREALVRVMPVDEGLLTAEDVWMNFCIRRLGYKLILAPDVILWHYRRNSPRTFLRQAYRFAVGRAQAAKRSASLLKPFHVIAALTIPLILLLPPAVVVTCAVITVPVSLALCGSFRAAMNAPLAAAIFGIGWSAGFLREIFFPMKDVKGR